MSMRACPLPHGPPCIGWQQKDRSVWSVVLTEIDVEVVLGVLGRLLRERVQRLVVQVPVYRGVRKSWSENSIST